MYYDCRDKFNQPNNTLETAALMIFLNKTCFNGLYRENKKGEFNVAMGCCDQPTICDAETIYNASNALQGVDIVCSSYEDCLDFVDNKKLVYADPPYRGAFTSYSSKGFYREDQVALHDFVDTLTLKGAKVIVSNSYDGGEFFLNLYSGYLIYQVSAQRSISCNQNGRCKVSELLISNF